MSLICSYNVPWPFILNLTASDALHCNGVFGLKSAGSIGAKGTVYRYSSVTVFTDLMNSGTACALWRWRVLSINCEILSFSFCIVMSFTTCAKHTSVLFPAEWRINSLLHITKSCFVVCGYLFVTPSKNKMLLKQFPHSFITKARFATVKVILDKRVLQNNLK